TAQVLDGDQQCLSSMQESVVPRPHRSGLIEYGVEQRGSVRRRRDCELGKICCAVEGPFEGAGMAREFRRTTGESGPRDADRWHALYRSLDQGHETLRIRGSSPCTSGTNGRVST